MGKCEQYWGDFFYLILSFLHWGVFVFVLVIFVFYFCCFKSYCSTQCRLLVNILQSWCATPWIGWPSYLCSFEWTSWGCRVDTQLPCISKLGRKHWDKSLNLFLFDSKVFGNKCISKYTDNGKYSWGKETYLKKVTFWKLFFPPKTAF